MPSTPYDLVEDDQDLRIPMHADQAFFQGITFQAKFIGWEEVPRPKNLAEIVQAMRRIRYECKVQNLKKRKVTVNVSVNGVRVLLKKRRRKKKQVKSDDPEEIELMHHPIYRIFYVSHDCSDLKIFSLIARDSRSDTFKCSVFKSNKKSQAMRVVSTVGQAFEVCHQFNLQKNSLDNNDETSDLSFELYDLERRSQNSDDDSSKKDHNAITPDISIQPPQRPNHLELGTQINSSNNHKSSLSDGEKSPTSPMSSGREVQKLKEQLEHQSLQTRQALAQLILVREQLISETNARMEAQARTQQLLLQNRELLEHLASLGAYTEPQQPSLTSANIAMAPQSHLSMLLENQSKSFLSPPNSNLASINQQINNLGSINQQLTNLSHQLNGLNQHNQSFQHLSPSPNPMQHGASNNNNGGQYPTISQLQNISSQLSNISAQNNQEALNKELFQMNQDLLNQLQALNLGNNFTNGPGTPNNNSLFFANPMSCSPNSNATNTNLNFLSTPSSIGNLTPSPMGTLNRNSYSNSHSPIPINHDELTLSLDKNLNNLEEGHIMKSLGYMGGQSNNNISDSTRSDSSSSPLKLSDQRLNMPMGNTVMLKVTDESGNITNTRKLSATPSFITRSTSEKVPNRSQIMSQVQRTAWARHTTK